MGVSCIKVIKSATVDHLKILITHHITQTKPSEKQTPKTPKHRTALETAVGYSVIALAKGLALLHTVWKCGRR